MPHSCKDDCSKILAEPVVNISRHQIKKLKELAEKARRASVKAKQRRAKTIVARGATPSPPSPRRFWQRSRGTLISDHQTRPHQTSDTHQTIRTTPQKVYVLLHCSMLLVYLE